MVTVCPCGCESPDDASYCKDCGRALAAPATEILDLPGTTAEQSGRLVKSGGQRQFWVPVATMLVVLAVIGGGIALIGGAGGDDGDDGAEGGGEAAADAGDDEAAGEEPADEGHDSPGASDGDDDDHEGELETSPTTAAVTGPIDSYGPVLDDEVDYDLLIGTDGRPVVIDLATGDVHRPEGGLAEPIGHTGEWLVVRRNGGIFALPLSDLSAEPVAVTDGSYEFVDLYPTGGGDDDGLVWLWGFDDDTDFRPRLILAEVGTQQELAHPLDGMTDIVWTPFGLYPDPEAALFTARTGGVYEATAEGDARLVDGRLVAADERRMLVEQCDDRFDCGYRWFGRDGRPLELALPSWPADTGHFLNGTDWLATALFGGPEPERRLLNVETGQVVEPPEVVDDPSATLNEPSAPAVSPDGRWLAIPDPQADSVEILNPATGSSIVLEIDADVRPSALFVPDR